MRTQDKKSTCNANVQVLLEKIKTFAKLYYCMDFIGQLH